MVVKKLVPKRAPQKSSLYKILEQAAKVEHPHKYPADSQLPAAFEPHGAGSILREAANIVEGARQQTHGEHERSFVAIAGAWNAYLAARKDPLSPITSTDVAWMMAWLKTVRSVQGEFVRDHAVDAAGYAAIAGKIGGKV